MEITPLHGPGMLPNGILPSGISGVEQGFADLLKEAVNTVSDLQHKADTAARDFAVGDKQGIHDTMIALEKADLSLRLLTQVRNKAVEAYQEIMRMPM